MASPANGTALPRFMSAEGLHARLHFLQEYARIALEYPEPPREGFPDPLPSFLLIGAKHGNVTDAVSDQVAGRPTIGVSLKGRNFRFLHPLDYCAVSLCTAFGLPWTVQKTGTGFDYPRVRANMPGIAKGQNLYLLRALADAGPWQTVQHLASLRALGSAGEAPGVDHHYLGRDAMKLVSVKMVWNAGHKSRVPRLGRADLLKAALRYLDWHGAEAEFAPSPEAYAGMIRLAFTLADWRHGRADGKPAGIMPPILTTVAA